MVRERANERGDTATAGRRKTLRLEKRQADKRNLQGILTDR